MSTSWTSVALLSRAFPDGAPHTEAVRRALWQARYRVKLAAEVAVNGRTPQLLVTSFVTGETAVERAWCLYAAGKKGTGGEHEFVAKGRAAMRVLALGRPPGLEGWQWVPSPLLENKVLLGLRYVACWELRRIETSDPGEHTMPTSKTWQPHTWLRYEQLAAMPSHVVRRIVLSEEDSAEYLGHEETCLKEGCGRCQAIQEKTKKPAVKKTQLWGGEILERCPHDGSWLVDVSGVPLKWVVKYGLWHLTDGRLGPTGVRTYEKMGPARPDPRSTCPADHGEYCPVCRDTQRKVLVEHGQLQFENIFGCKEPLKSHYQQFFKVNEDRLPVKIEVPELPRLVLVAAKIVGTNAEGEDEVKWCGAKLVEQPLREGNAAVSKQLGYVGDESAGPGVPDTEGFIGYGTGYWTDSSDWYVAADGERVWVNTFVPSGLQRPQRWPVDMRRPKRVKGMEPMFDDLELGYSTTRTHMPTVSWQPRIEWEVFDWQPAGRIWNYEQAVKKAGRMLERLETIALNWTHKWDRLPREELRQAQDMLDFEHDRAEAKDKLKVLAWECLHMDLWLKDSEEGVRLMAVVVAEGRKAVEAVGGLRPSPALAEERERLLEALGAFPGHIRHALEERTDLICTDEQSGMVWWNMPKLREALHLLGIVPREAREQRRRKAVLRRLKRAAKKKQRLRKRGLWQDRHSKSEEATRESIRFALTQVATAKKTGWLLKWQVADLVGDYHAAVSEEIAGVT